jgi:hypothetical protein
MLFINKGMLFINTEVFLFITDISFVTNGEKNSPRVSGEILRLLVISYSELINSVMSSLFSRRVNFAPG